MKLKKKVKLVLITTLVVVIIAILGFAAYKMFFTKEEVKGTKIISSIEKYDYHLKDNKSKKYQAYFKELSKILESKEVDEEEYVSKITEMFIVDFFSLNDRSAKTDVGGVDFVHPDIIENFLQNAENTYYKNLESNIYGNRKQQLPTVDTITIESVETTTYTYNETEDTNAYLVKATWTYTDNKFSDYQQTASLVFVHQDKKLYLVELTK